MTPEDFAALLKLMPDEESVREYALVALEEYKLRGRREFIETSAGPFYNDQKLVDNLTTEIRRKKKFWSWGT